MVGDLGEVLVGLVVAVAGFVAVVLVCAVLLALFQRILPGGPSPARDRRVEGPASAGPQEAPIEEIEAASRRRTGETGER